MYKKSFLVLLAALAYLPVSAKPVFLKDYRSINKSFAFAEPKTELMNCGLCHIRKGGGGARNEFGVLFELNDNKFTEEFIKENTSFFTVK